MGVDFELWERRLTRQYLELANDPGKAVEVIVPIETCIHSNFLNREIKRFLKAKHGNNVEVCGLNFYVETEALLDFLKNDYDNFDPENLLVRSIQSKIDELNHKYPKFNHIEYTLKS